MILVWTNRHFEGRGSHTLIRKFQGMALTQPATSEMHQALHCHAEVAASSLLHAEGHRLLPPSRKSCRVLLPSDPPPSLSLPPLDLPPFLRST
jgi:hypothetical protein